MSKELWEPWSQRLQPPGTFDFNESVLDEALASDNRGLMAAALLFAAEFENAMGRDGNIEKHLLKAVEALPDNPATLRAIVEHLESFHRPGEALPYAERLAQVSQGEVPRWMLGQIKYLSGDKAGAIKYWQSLPFYQRANGPATLKLYVEGCERRLAQYGAFKNKKDI